MASEISDKSNKLLLEKYQQLLLSRDEFQREARNWELEYMRVFGELELQLYKLQIDCIEKKKRLNFIQSAINKGENVQKQDLEFFICNEMTSYNEKLKVMLDKKTLADSGKEISDADASKIKKIYRTLAKTIHPDICPITNENPVLKELWERLVCSYEANDLDSIQEVELLIHLTLEKLDVNESTFTPNFDNSILNERISRVKMQIDEIIQNMPYRYKDFFASDETKNARMQNLKIDIDDLTKYNAELNEILQQGERTLWAN